jgi:hypothetical protein
MRIRNFNEFINESLILEMPHIMLGDKVVDLELEVHAKMKPKDFVQYIDDWVNGKPIQSKTPGFSMKVNADSVKEFAKKVLSQPYLKNFTIMHYGEDTWASVENLLRAKL